MSNLTECAYLNQHQHDEPHNYVNKRFDAAIADINRLGRRDAFAAGGTANTSTWERDPYEKNSISSVTDGRGGLRRRCREVFTYVLHVKIIRRQASRPILLVAFYNREESFPTYHFHEEEVVGIVHSMLQCHHR